MISFMLKCKNSSNHTCHHMDSPSGSLMLIRMSLMVISYVESNSLLCTLVSFFSIPWITSFLGRLTMPTGLPFKIQVSAFWFFDFKFQLLSNSSSSQVECQLRWLCFSLSSSWAYIISCLTYLSSSCLSLCSSTWFVRATCLFFLVTIYLGW